MTIIRKRITFSEGDYKQKRFVTLRMLERGGFERGTEIEIEFLGRTLHEGFGMARRAATVYAGLLREAGGDDTTNFVEEIGPHQGEILGCHTPGGEQGWRIDCNPDELWGFHVNWWDRRLSKKRANHYYGSNFVVGAGQDFFWQVRQHFPGQVEPKRQR